MRTAAELELGVTSHIVLGLIAEAGEATPYDLKSMVANGVGDLWTVHHAQLYALAARLAEAGYLREEREHEGRRRKRYSLTDAGRRALESWLETSTDEVTELRDHALVRLFFGADPAALAPAQVEAHRRRLERYESQLRDFGSLMPRGRALALKAGTEHERVWVEFWARLASGQSP